ncbi:hypothetical protein M758_UG316600 [Ceratodon purpureus]|nr:hypothetical protein M758_UG316600 [Ceratodon purpureus]
MKCLSFYRMAPKPKQQSQPSLAMLDQLRLAYNRREQDQAFSRDCTCSAEFGTLQFCLTSPCLLVRALRLAILMPLRAYWRKKLPWFRAQSLTMAWFGPGVLHSVWSLVRGEHENKTSCYLKVQSGYREQAECLPTTTSRVLLAWKPPFWISRRYGG